MLREWQDSVLDLFFSLIRPLWLWRLSLVKTNIRYLRYTPNLAYEKPYICEFDVSGVPGARSRNFEFDNHEILARDIRGYTDYFTLERNGFEIMKHRTALGYADLQSPDKHSAYLEECKEVLKKRFDAEDVLILEYQFRENAKDKSERYENSKQPVTVAHVDQTQAAVFYRLVHKLGKERATEIYKTRRCIIANIWRPLVDPVEESPLSFCDTATVSPEDCVSVDFVKRGDYDEESIYVRHSPRHQFYYISNQRPDEITLLKMAESNPAFPGRRYQGDDMISVETV